MTPRPGSPRLKGRTALRRVAQLLLAVSGLTALVGVVGVALFYALILRDLPELDSLDDYRPNLVTRVWSADGVVIGEFAEERREIVPIEQVPEFVVHAFVAAEDNAFYTHEGLDYPGIARAAWANLRAGGIKQGGSTIIPNLRVGLLFCAVFWARWQ